MLKPTIKFFENDPASSHTPPEKERKNSEASRVEGKRQIFETLIKKTVKKY